MGEQRTHWDRVYEGKAADQVSWYTPHLARSLAFIEAAGLAPDAAMLDVGGGASTLVDDLLARRFSDITVLDLSAAAVRKARERLGERAASVRWVVGDVTEVELPEASVDFWHDRAVFHFLREEEARRRYVASVRRAVKPGGHVLVATFGPDGPERCSGLDVLRYGAEEIHAEFGPAFRKVGSATEEHTTPGGSVQQFVYCYCRLPGGGGSGS